MVMSELVEFVVDFVRLDRFVDTKSPTEQPRLVGLKPSPYVYVYGTNLMVHNKGVIIRNP